MDVQLRLELFGAYSVSLQASAWPAQRSLALNGRLGGLLALLALGRGQTLNRGELCRELWGAGPESASAACFNTLLWRLRRALELPPDTAAIIETDRQGGVRIARHVLVQSDLERYLALVEKPLAKPVDQLEPADVQALREAVLLYRGDVLAGYQDDWALRLRERHRRTQLGALARLMHLSSLQGRWQEAIQHGEAMLDMDALREDVHRELMRCHLAAGQRALALTQFERCRSALKRELAIAPMAETLALYQEIAREATQPAAPSAPLTPARRGLFEPHALPYPAATPAQVLLPWSEALMQVRWHLAQADAQLQTQLDFGH